MVKAAKKALVEVITARAERFGFDHTACGVISSACFNSVPSLDLSTFANFKDADFLHDVAGIIAYYDVSLRRFNNLFLPRCRVRDYELYRRRTHE